MDYNTQREKLIMPEYGRHIQKMIEQTKAIEDKEKRSEQVKAIVQTMGILAPQMRELNDYRHKLWDHVYAIMGYDADIDSPYPAPELSEISRNPEPIELPKTAIKATCYGRNIENMINLIAEHPDDEDKTILIRRLAIYMRQQYLIWNKDSVAEETIFADIEKLSGGKLRVPENVHLNAISADAKFSRPGLGFQGGQSGNHSNFNKNKKKGKNNGRKG